MEREEAIKICKEIRKYLCAGNPIWDTEKIHEALTTAIIDMKMMPRVLNTLNIVRNTVENASQEHPYKEIGKFETYSEYNEGWSDACARIESVLDTLLSNEPVVTLDDLSNAYENGYAQGKFEASGDSTNQ